MAATAEAARAASANLLDGRGWEMVSPIAKNGGEVQGFGGNAGGDVLQAAADGESFTFSSASSFGGEAKGAPVASQYLARRGAGGWSSEDVTQATVAGAYGESPAGVPYRLFSPDLARGVMSDGCAGAPPCALSYSLRGGGGTVLEATSPAESDLRFVGAAPDLRHLVLSTCAALTANAVEVPAAGGCDPAAPNLYEWDGSGLELLNVLPGDSQGTPGAVIASQVSAVSADGSRVYFAMLEDGPLLVHQAGGATTALPETSGGGARFQAASAGGAVAFFTKGGTLFRYELASDTSEPIASGVEGVLGISEDGSHVYYLTAAGLFLHNGGATVEVAAAADPSDFPPATATARVSPDGSRLLFLSKAPLTGYDNSDLDSGEPDTEAFLYDATANGGAGGLSCVSCNRPGVAPIGPSSIPGTVANGSGPESTRAYRPRALVDGGHRVFFDSLDSLVNADTNNRVDVYEWEAAGVGSCALAAGCLQLISSGRAEGGASFLDASADGDDAFFLTGASLVPTDPGAVDVYDARVGGGFPTGSSQIPCEGDACQPLPSPPEDPTPGTLVPSAGNPPVTFPRQKKPKKHRHKKHGRKNHGAGKHHRRGGRR